MLEFRENMTFFRIVFKSSNFSYPHSRRKVLFSLHRKWCEFSAAWCLSIVSQAGSISFDVCLRKRNSCDDEKGAEKSKSPRF